VLEPGSGRGVLGATVNQRAKHTLGDNAPTLPEAAEIPWEVER
jgi:hypothetical protein